METMGGELVMHNEVNPPSERRNVGLNAGPASLTSQSALRWIKGNPDYKGQTYKQHFTSYNRNAILGYTTAHCRAPVANTRN